jgi:predicted alpha/beta superfamily hydrolase
MHDGQNLFDPEQSKYAGWDWGVDEALTALGLEVIVVGVHSDEATRNIDYFPQKAGVEHAAAFARDFGRFDPDELNADNYLAFLVEELKPRIDASYRTQPEREHTTIMGSSMGGLISLYAISEYPNVFGAAGMVSTHFPPGDGVLVNWFANHLPEPDQVRLYFDFGTETLDHNYEGYQDQMDAALRAAGYEAGKNWTTRKFEGHDHSERAWRNRVHVPLQFLLAGNHVNGGEER